MDREEQIEPVYMERDDTEDGYRSYSQTVPNNIGIFVVYDGFKTRDGLDCLRWYVIGEDESLSDINSSWYLLREFTLGYSCIYELSQYVDEGGVFVAPEDPFRMT
ncbi:hypothetical protein BGW42_008231 [Actinomortierella wolfii]|nr:hypothetical protein BGW42_008231 [Actinomortierella wolfii]